MRTPGTSWSCIAALILAGVATCLIPGQANANWIYEYKEDFINNNEIGRASCRERV